jgi:hypothetical protein
LRTLYHIFAGKAGDVFAQGSSKVQYNVDPQFGVDNSYSNHSDFLAHWKENLAIIIGNPVPGSADTIRALGDELWHKTGDVDAAHFCYLLAGESIDHYADPNARLVLLGADNRTSEGRFVSLEVTIQ